MRPEAEPAGVVRIEPGDRVVVTGAAGFIGSAVTRAVQARGAHVVAVVEPGGDGRNLDGADVERAVLDIQDSAAVRTVCQGARFVFHLAAIYRFWATDPGIFSAVNVGGTLNVLSAVRAAGCERMVYTSTVGVLGLEPAVRGEPIDETSYADISHLFGRYKRTKFVAEHEVLRAAAEGLDVCLALPTFPLGAGDRRPTPTGRLVVDFLNGKMPAFVDTAMNVTHVDDLALGHIAALERGTRGRSYILGGDNMSMREILRILAAHSGLAAPRARIPHRAVLAAAAASTLIEGRLMRTEPRVPLEAARMSGTKMIFSDKRARAEIGHTSRPASDAIEESARWFADNGYVSERRLRKIRWQKLCEGWQVPRCPPSPGEPARLIPPMAMTNTCDLLGLSSDEQLPGMIRLAEFQLHRVFRRVEPKLLPPEEVRPAASANMQRIGVAGALAELAPGACERRCRMRPVGDDLHKRTNDPCHIIECTAFKQVTKLVTREVVMEVGFSFAGRVGLVRLRRLKFQR